MSETPANDKEKKNPGPVGPGEPETGPEIPVADEKIIAVHKKTVPCQIERVTALRGQSIAHPRRPKNVLRRQSQYDIYGKDPEIPYVKFEAAARDLVCSLMERQDRMNEEIFYKINNLAYRVDDLEQNQISKGGQIMTRGRRPINALKEAVEIAGRRGSVEQVSGKRTVHSISL